MLFGNGFSKLDNPLKVTYKTECNYSYIKHYLYAESLSRQVGIVGLVKKDHVWCIGSLNIYFKSKFLYFYYNEF